MARVVGGHIPGPTLAAVPVAAWTDPAVGNLVAWDASGNMMVREAVANDLPDGQVIAVNPTRTVVTVELFTGGMVAVLPYAGMPVRGDRIEAEGTVTADEQGRVRADNVNGTGRVVARDRVAGYVDVYFA